VGWRRSPWWRRRFPSWRKVLAVAEAPWALLSLLLIADVAFGITGRGESNVGAWVLFFAGAPLAILVDALGVTLPEDLWPLWLFVVIVFYAGIFAIPAIVVHAVGGNECESEDRRTKRAGT
jgi:hypothetical protein